MLDLHKKTRPAYDRLAVQWSECTLCPLHEHRRTVVMARGEMPCQVLYIGEAPGRNEDANGEPFTGDAGKRLDEIISELPKHSHAVINVMGCIPYKDPTQKTNPFSSSVEMRAPSEYEAACCRPRLLSLVGLANPRGVVYLGRTASRFALPYISLPSVEVVHPAALIRSNAGPGHSDYERCVLQIGKFLETLFSQRSRSNG